MLENLEKYNVLLASKSPRRRELLQQLRVNFKIVTLGGIDESYPDDIPALQVAQFVAQKKADAFEKMIDDNELIITADTLVVCGDEILGKPKDADDAVRMLKTLSGKTHHVATGVTITTKDRRTAFTTVTDVKFAELSDDDILYYVNSYSPLDKAGAYGIQEWIGAVAVEAIYGSYYNVMGLPVHRLYQELKLF